MKTTIKEVNNKERKVYQCDVCEFESMYYVGVEEHESQRHSFVEKDKEFLRFENEQQFDRFIKNESYWRGPGWYHVEQDTCGDGSDWIKLSFVDDSVIESIEDDLKMLEESFSNAKKYSYINSNK